MPPPNIADRMNAVVSLGDQLRQPIANGGILPQSLLKLRHLLGRQCLFDVSQEGCVVEG
jgi:hypothetical protein